MKHERMAAFIQIKSHQKQDTETQQAVQIKLSGIPVEVLNIIQVKLKPETGRKH